MCDLTAKMLSEMTSFAKSIQALPTLETPEVDLSHTRSNQNIPGRSSLRPASVSLEKHPNGFASPDLRAQQRASMPPQQFSTDLRSSTPESGNHRRAGTPPAGRDSADRDRNSSKYRSSIHGFGSGSSGERERIRGKARIGVVVGSLYLLAGRWPDALRELSDNGSILRAHSDYVWLAKALDYLLVTAIMYTWADLDFRVRRGNKSKRMRLLDLLS